MFYNTPKLPEWFRESDHRHNPEMQDFKPKDLKPPVPKPHWKGPLKRPQNPTSPYDNINQDLVNHRFILWFPRPDLRIVEFTINEMPECLFVAWEQENMKLSLDWCYSVDSGHTYSRYYSNGTEYEKFMQIIRDVYGRGMEVTIKLRLETELTKESNYEEAVQDEAYYVGVLNIWCNGKPVRIDSSYVINAAGLTLPQQGQLWDPYANMDTVFRIQTQASISINHIFGHWAYYFKTDPDKDTRNMTLKAYQLYNVVDMKKIKISVPNNAFPNKKNVYSEWGIALPDEFTVHVLIDTFEKAFGPGTFPHTNDYVYFPITGKMYNVNAYIENTNFMYKSIFWECTLVKYEDNANVIKGEFESDTTNFMDLEAKPEMLDDVIAEVENADPVFLDTHLYEAFRLNLNKTTEIVNHELWNARIKLFDNMYRFTGVDPKDVGVSFNLKMSGVDNISLYMWLLIEKKSPSRDMIIIKDTSDLDVIKLSLNKGNLELTYDKTSVTTDIEIPTDIRIGVLCNVSVMYRYIELMILGYDETRQNATKILTIQKVDIPVPLVYLLSEMKLMGGKHLISNIGIDRLCYSKDDASKILTQVTPNSEVNVLFDKANLPITEDTLNGY